VDYEALLRAPGRHVHMATPAAGVNTTVQDDRGANGKGSASDANVDRVIATLRRPRFKPVKRRTINTFVDDPIVVVDSTTTIKAMAGVHAPPPRIPSVSGIAIFPEHFQIFVDPTGELGVEGPPGVSGKIKSRSKKIRAGGQDENNVPFYYGA
jgi:hypothetical protein